MKIFSRICLILLYLPGVITTGLSGELTFNNIRKKSLFSLAIVVMYWLALVASATLIIFAYLGK